MGSNPADAPGAPPSGDPPPPTPRPSDPSQRDRHARVQERCGPVAIERHVKDDGRSLLLYTREAEQA
jgi:hypothetical protein